MLTLIVLAIVTIGVGFFATQNTSQISINFGLKNVDNIPVYIAILLPLFIGLVASWLTNIGSYIESKQTKRRLKNDITEAHAEVAELTKRVHKLELENTKLKAEAGKPLEDEESI